MPRKIAKAKQEDLELDVWHKSYTPRELQAYRRKLAKRANQRLVRLERAKSSVSGESLSGIGASEQAYAYLGGQKKGKRRFTERLDSGLSDFSLKREIAVLQGFLSGKSSLVSGMREIEEKRVKTFESGNWGSAKYTDGERRRLKFSDTKEFYDFFHSETYRDLYSQGFTSEQIVEAYDVARDTGNGADEEAMEALERALEEFRAKGRATLKDLRAAARGQPWK